MNRNESPKKTYDNKMKIDPWINVSSKRKILYDGNVGIRYVPKGTIITNFSGLNLN